MGRLLFVVGVWDQTHLDLLIGSPSLKIRRSLCLHACCKYQQIIYGSCVYGKEKVSNGKRTEKDHRAELSICFFVFFIMINEGENGAKLKKRACVKTRFSHFEIGIKSL